MAHVALLHHPACAGHDPGPGHAEGPERLAAVETALRSAGLWERLVHVEAPRATREQLERVHTAAYVAALHDLAPAEGRVVLDPDTSMSPGTLEAALRAAGAACHAVDKVLDGAAERAFCLVRPPGHHAEPDRAMGFCLFDNVAVAAAHALGVRGLSRVAIVDVDVHHGNGTEAIFRGDPRVMVCQTFQSPLYPDLPFVRGDGHLVNAPLPAGSDGAALLAALDDRLLPALDAFRPQLLLVSAGFDAHAADPLAGLTLHEDDYRVLTERLVALSRHHAGGRVVSVLEGGYDLTALGRSVTAHVSALLDG